MIPGRLLFMKQLERIQMIFWKTAKKSITIDFQHPRTNQAPQVILTGQSINMYGNGMVFTIGGQKDVDKIQIKLMV